ncbi:hypothetical protein [Methylocaldum sp. GT1TLB]|uniref:hypothetical protein n=1 Tax=Methylocaldum sp. GT1TLB TaxID=3438965 RepID=UPI003DA10395
MYERYQSESTTAPALRAGTTVRYPVSAAWWRAPQVLVALLAVCLCSLVILYYLSARLETTVAGPAEGHARIKAINQQMEALQRKFGILLAESVEMRLKTLQKNIEAGAVSSADLEAFEQLKSDLVLLEGYAEAGGANAFDNTEIEHSRFRRLSGSGVVRNEELMDEVLQVKNLLYFCAASLATTTVLISGYWLRQRSRAYRLHSGMTAVPMLAKKPGD